MKKQYIKWVGICFLSLVGIVAVLYLVAMGLSKANIHIISGNSTWIGLIGALAGGVYTMAGVLLTLYKQDEDDKSQKRLEYMPILTFQLINELPEAINIWQITCVSEEALIHNKPDHRQIGLKYIRISVINCDCAFEVKIDGCAINGKCIQLHETIKNTDLFLIKDNEYYLGFYDVDPEEKCYTIRFAFRDIFGNKYIQDLPLLCRAESEGCMGRQIQHIQFKNAQPPVLASEAIPLDEVSKKYV